MDEKYNGFYPEGQNNEAQMNTEPQADNNGGVSQESQGSQSAGAQETFGQPETGYQTYGENPGQNTQWQSPNSNDLNNRSAEMTHNTNTGYITSDFSQQRNYSNYIPPDNKKRKSGGWKVFVAGVAGVVVGCVLMAAVAGGLDMFGISPFTNNNESNNAVPPQKIEISNNTPEEVVAIASKAGRSVVGVAVSGSQTDPFFGTQQTEGSGSGVIVRADGYILTNYHVIQSALDVTGKQASNSSIKVNLPNVDKPYNATIVGQDQRTDLAVLKIDATNLPAIEWGDSSALKVGELTVAIGNPGGLELAGSVTTGVVSGLNRKISSEYNAELTLIQTSAAINPGNSGGALVNKTGQLIGVNSSKIAGNGYEGIGFAIPSNEAKNIIEGLIKYGRVKGRPWFGVSINNEYNADYAKQYGYPEGLLVAEVRPFSGASDAGMQKNDIITKFDGVETKTFSQLEEQKAKHKPGDVVKVEIYRPSQKKALTLNVKLSEEQAQ